MGITIDEAITKYKNNAEYERTHGNLQGCLEFRQLAKRLEKLQKIKEIVDKWNEGIYDDEGLTHTEVMELVSDEVLEDGNDK
ncbi:hypothetical protein [Butyrivibrio sp.]|uniref:hypothetical protein n=1 Tax=Butyrivibrio sp. TaxID=28121 RepID=UPI0025C3EA3C|nr:hypothetical protein [Butyrivibrio sp.]MBQ7428358.1 hypothetical protein [Butyrivibrio sp.]MBQ9303662.1 hypothetical protein [Butyrivibrio sp.]